MAFKFPSSKQSSMKPFKAKSSSGNSIALLLAKNMMAKQNLPEGSVPTQATAGGVQYETPEGTALQAKKLVMSKAGEDVLKLGQSYKFIEALEKDYIEAYKNVKDRSGIQGGFSALGEYTRGVVGRGNDALRRYVNNRGASGVAIGRFSGDVGNFAWQEQEAHLKRLPRATPNSSVSNLFLPDDPEFGMSLFNNIKSIYAEKMKEAFEVSQTGQLTPSYESWLKNNLAKDQTKEEDDPLGAFSNGY